MFSNITRSIKLTPSHFKSNRIAKNHSKPTPTQLINNQSPNQPNLVNLHKPLNPTPQVQPKKKTIQEKDEEIQAILNDQSGGINAVEIDLQDGQLSGLKQNVKRNMFRVI